MKKTEIMNKLSKSFHRTGLKLKKYSPELLVGAGIIGVISSGVMACKATTKLDDILAEPKEKIEKIHELMEDPEQVPEGETYTEEDGKKDLVIVYTQSVIKVAKLYAPAMMLGTVSIAAILGGHHLLRKRNVALAAAYATIDKGFKEYRGRVVERFGKELDKELKYNIKSEEIEEVTKNEDGTETSVKKTVNVANISEYSDYARFFDDGCNGWSKDPEFNLMFLKDQQRYANDLLKSRGHLFLNDVYRMLGIPSCKSGQIVGWIYDENNPIGDNFVDFGIYNVYNEANRNFVNGYERSILLDFNVDGDILDLI